MDAGFIQKRMNELQNDAGFQNALGKLVSGRAGYRPVIEKKYIPVKCRKCSTILDDSEKFCHECGTRVEKN